MKPSEYLYDTVERNMDGEIPIDEAGELIHANYNNIPNGISDYLLFEEFR